MAEKKTVVCIEDEPEMIDLVRLILGRKGFELIGELAEALGGAVGATRAAIDAGWMPYPHQVGQTGRTVRPRL